MKFSVLINSYNNQKFLLECVDSALAQTYRPHEIVIVDDGSTDESVALLQKAYGSNPLVKIIQQENQGQLSAIITGIESATGDVVTFLDSDDTYKPGYLFELEKAYRENPKVNFVFCRFEPFGIPPYCSGLLPEWLEGDYDFGYSTLLTYFTPLTPLWGSCTIATSLTRRLANKLYLREANQIGQNGWHADDLMNLAAGLLRARKFYIHKALVNYRHHEGNYWATNKRHDADARYHVKLLFSSLVNFYKGKCYFTEDLKKFLHEEMATIPRPHKEHLALYYKILNAKDPITGKTLTETLSRVDKIPWWKKAERKIRGYRKKIISKKA